MLASAETIETIADALAHHKAQTIVLDPVSDSHPFPTYSLTH